MACSTCELQELGLIWFVYRANHVKHRIGNHREEFSHNGNDTLGALVWVKPCGPDDRMSFKRRGPPVGGHGYGVLGYKSVRIELRPHESIGVVETDNAVCKFVTAGHIDKLGTQVIKEEQREQTLDKKMGLA